MRGGKRPGAGRPRGDRQHILTVKIDYTTRYCLECVPNKSAYICNLVKKDFKNNMQELNLSQTMTDNCKYLLKEKKRREP